MQQAITHPVHGSKIGKLCEVILSPNVRDSGHKGIIHFVGTNHMGQEVISFEAPSRAIFFVTNWKKVKITLI